MAASPGSNSVPYNESFYPRAQEESESDSNPSDEESESKISATTVVSKLARAINVDNPIKKIAAHIGGSISQEEDVDPEKGDGRKESKSGKMAIEAPSCAVCLDLPLDPVTLSCGHSFCEICLAQVWVNERFQSSQQLKCPMCQKRWKCYPSVDIVLRDMIEQAFPEEVASRRASLTPEQQKLLGRFQLVRAKEAASLRQQQVHNIVIPPRTLLLVFVVAFVVGVLLLVLAFAGVWAYGGLRDHFTLKPVSQWSSAEVQDWMKGLGETIQYNCLEIFDKERIDGRHLLILTDEMLLQLGVDNSYVRRSLLLSIEELKEGVHLTPQNFEQFKAAYREETVLLLLIYKTHPRLTFCYLYLFHYYAMFLPIVQSQLQARDRFWPKAEEPHSLEDDPIPQTEVERDTEGELELEMLNSAKKPVFVLTSHKLLAVVVEILLVPHLMVAWYFAGWITMHPILCSIVLLNCTMCTLTEARILKHKLRARGLRFGMLFKTYTCYFLVEVVGFVMIWMLSSVIFFFLPSFLLDLIFYSLLFHSVFTFVRSCHRWCCRR